MLFARSCRGPKKDITYKKNTCCGDCCCGGGVDGEAGGGMDSVELLLEGSSILALSRTRTFTALVSLVAFN